MSHSSDSKALLPFQTLDLIHSSRFENIVKALTGQCEWKQVIDGDDELKQRLETQGIENHDFALNTMG